MTSRTELAAVWPPTADVAALAVPGRGRHPYTAAKLKNGLLEADGSESEASENESPASAATDPGTVHQNPSEDNHEHRN